MKTKLSTRVHVLYFE